MFAAPPNANFKLNYELRPAAELPVAQPLGYNVFWISGMLRASNQLVSVNAPTYAQ